MSIFSSSPKSPSKPSAFAGPGVLCVLVMLVQWQHGHGKTMLDEQPAGYSGIFAEDRVSGAQRRKRSGGKIAKMADRRCHEYQARRTGTRRPLG